MSNRKAHVQRALTQESMKKRVGIAFRRFMMGQSPGWKYRQVFGCEPEFMRAFMEHQFRHGMSWENFGLVWQVDHVLSLSAFDQTDDGEVNLCWNWVNLRPGRVGSRIPVSYQSALTVLEHRKRAFPTNPVIGKLAEIAFQSAEGEYELTDWSGFQYHLVHESVVE